MLILLRSLRYLLRSFLTTLYGWKINLNQIIRTTIDGKYIPVILKDNISRSVGYDKKSISLDINPMDANKKGAYAPFFVCKTFLLVPTWVLLDVRIQDYYVSWNRGEIFIIFPFPFKTICPY